MSTASQPKPVRQDRRVRRSRAALFAAAVRLVSERGSTSVSITELAEAADMSRQAVYSQFEDRDSLFVAAGVDLMERELFPELSRCADGGPHAMALVGAEHLARHRAYYRALATGSCAYAVKQAVINTVAAWQAGLDRPLAPGLDLSGADVMTTFLVGGMFAVFSQWLIDGDEPPDPHRVTDQVLGVAAALRRFGAE
ncbi:TetR/AcrR family transcriptional regulator [Nocardia bovistercoris]|uniref:TetR/AcrR family transcriptional regulator n=1 Tax=Nocardia bovistercoris TaxID=2785916 RepID=A0A931IDI9_9NOCA|nr:TetR/AcrR family transcriptional regulator [Nocardia bovistercoris]MBH0777850.1 TetR/AcrR family transcriptional regulator [Nocardia bovistercoris]